MMRFLGMAALSVLIAACAGAWRGTAAPVDTGRLAGEVGALLDLMREQDALYDRQGDFSGRLRLAVCRAVDPGAEIVDAAEAALREEEDVGIFYGIGVQLELRDRRPRILKVLPESPAADAGVPVGALIEKIDEADTLDMPLADAVARLRGRRDQPVTLHLRVPAPPAEQVDAALEEQVDALSADVPDARELKTVRVTRSLVQMPVTGMTEQWPLQLAYIKVNGIYDGSGAYIISQFREWATQETAGIILDLRGAAGVDLESVAALGSLFASAGQPLFGIRAGRGGEVRTFTASDQPALTIPVMALIDGDTRAASAILAAVLRNCRGAMLIGAASDFDMALRTFIPLPDGQLLHTATRLVELPGMMDANARIVPDVQIAPDARVPPAPVPEKQDDDIFSKTSDQERLERALSERIGADVALRRAADILLGLKALDIKSRL